MLDEVTLGIVGIVAGVLILSGWVPQIIRGYKTKKLNDLQDDINKGWDHKGI